MAEESFFETLITSIYQLIIISCVAAMGFVYYLYRTRMPLKESTENEETDAGHEHPNVHGQDQYMSESSNDLLKAIVDGLRMSENVDEDEGLEEGENDEEEEEQEEEEEEEEENESSHKASKKRQIIREVTVRKLILPPQADYSDIDKIAAKTLIGRAIEKRKNVPISDGL